MMATIPPGEWGRRLSDRIRAALDAADLGSARKLALEGDGQARSLEKEYALMCRGLGITVRALLRLLGTRPPRPALVPLVRDFRRDLVALLAGDEPAEAAPAELEGTSRLLDATEDRFMAEQSRLARETLAAIEAGDARRARALVADKEARYLALHDRLIRFMAEVFGHVLREFGPAELLGFHRETAEEQRPGFERWERMSAAEFAQASAFLLKQHMGRVEVREDEEKYTIEQAPCGSGGRLRLGGAYAGPRGLPFVEMAGPLTLGRDRFPVYCSHCPIWNGVAPIAWFGRPHWVFDEPARPDGSCTLHVYKRREGAPADYLRRLAVGGDDR
jgi:hypothetical protein